MGVVALGEKKIFKETLAKGRRFTGQHDIYITKDLK